MHMLSTRYHSEFMGCPQLVRLTIAQGRDGPETTLLIKASTLTLKYLVRLKCFGLEMVRIGEKWLAYGIRINDDSKSPAILWSMVEHTEEIDALKALTNSPKCVVFLFNELAVTTAWTDADIDLSDKHARALVEATMLHPAEADCIDEVSKKFDSIFLGNHDQSRSFAVTPPEVTEWHPVYSHYITQNASSSFLSLFEKDEGAQQEALALWLVDSLHPQGATKSPQIREASKTRELSDVLLSYEFGTTLIESKTLSILTRDLLPDRQKLARNIIKHIDKATGQLVGGAKNLRRGLPITDLAGNELKIERKQPPHIIILVPDLSLLSDATQYGAAFFANTSREAGGFFHILDPSELLRFVQAAEMIARRSSNVTPMMAFDGRLLERAKHAMTASTPHFEILVKFAEKPPSGNESPSD